MGQPRYVPIQIQVSGGQQGAAEVKPLTNAFQQLDQSSDKASSGGLRNAFDASSTLRSEMTALGSQIPIVGRFFSGLTSDALRYIQQSRAVTAEVKNQRVAFTEFQKLLTSIAQGKGPVSSNLFHGFQLDAGLRDPKNAFRGFVQEFQKIEDPAQRSAIAVDIFGKKAGAILPVLENTAAAEASMIAATVGVGSSMLAVLGPIALVIAAVVALVGGFGIAGKAAFDLAKLAADAGSEIHETTQKVNFSAETISGLGVAAKTSGSDLGTLTNALGTFDKNLQQARESDTKLAKQFRDFNIDLKDNETALRSVFRALAALPAGEKQVELAMLAFGQAGKDVLAIVKETNGNIDQAIAKYQKMGLVISGDAAKAADEFNDQLTILDLQIKMVGVSIGQQLMPYVLTFIQAASRFVMQNGPAVRAWAAGTIESIKNVSHVVGRLASEYARVQTLGVEMTNSGVLKTAFTIAFPVLDQTIVYLKAIWGWLDKIGSYTREPNAGDVLVKGKDSLKDQYMALFPKLPDPKVGSPGGANTLEQISEATRKAQLDVQYFGKNTHLAQFNRAVADTAEQIKKLNYEETNRANALLAQWRTEAIRLDQLEAAKKAREAEADATKKANEEAVRQAEQLVQANERFAGSIEALKVRHAELTQTQSAARTELQKFEEEYAAGKFKDITAENIAAMREWKKTIDEDLADLARNKTLEAFAERIGSLQELIRGLTVEGESNLRRVRKSLIDTFDLNPTTLDAFIDRLKGGAELSGPEGAFEGFRALFSSDSLAKLSALNQNTAEFVGGLRKAIQADADLATVQTPLDQAIEEHNQLLKQQKELGDPVLMQQRFANELLRDHVDLQLRDFDASLSLARSQRELADAQVYNATQANASVAEFLAQQKNITEIVSDAKIGVVQTTFDFIDSALDRWTDKLGMVGGLVKQIISDFIRLALVPAFARMFGLSVGGGGGAVAQGGGGSGGFSIGNIFGGLFGGGSRGVGGTPPFAGFAGSSGASGGGFGALAGLFGGGGITAPASLSSQITNQASMAAAIQQGGGGAWGEMGRRLGFPGATGGSMLGGLAGSLASMAPLLGLTLGASLGGQSRFGSVLGAAGGGLLGLGIAGLLGSSSAAGLAGTIGSLGGLLPFSIGVLPLAIPLIVGALLLKKNAQRRADETSRNQLSLDTIGQLNALLAQARNMDLGQATASFEQIRVNYFNGVNQMKDSKTKRIATDWWYKPEHPPQVTWSKIKDAVSAGQRARDIEKHLIPEFALGGVVPWRTSLFSMATGMTPIKVRPGEAMFEPGASFGSIVPGVDRGYDSVLTAARPGTRVVPRSQVSGARGFQSGGMVGGDYGAPIYVTVELTNQLTVGEDTAAKIQKMAARTSDGRKAIVTVIRSERAEGN